MGEKGKWVCEKEGCGRNEKGWMMFRHCDGRREEEFADEKQRVSEEKRREDGESGWKGE